MNYKALEADNKYEAQIRSNNNFDYNSAQSYYKKIKLAMLNSLATETQSQMLVTTKDQTLKDLETQILNQANNAASNSSEVLNQAKQALSQIESIASGASISIKRAVTAAASAAASALTKKQSEYKNFSSTFTQNVRKQLTPGINQILDNMLKENIQGFSKASNLVQANMRNYLLRNLIQGSLFRNKKIGVQITTAASKYAQAIGGYFKEEAVVSAFNAAKNDLQGITKQLMPTAIDIAGKNLPNDFLFSTVFNQDEIDKLCSKPYEGQSHTKIIDPTLEQELIKSINIFGAQIKSYNLMKDTGTLTRQYFPIGMRSSLKPGLESSEEYLNGRSMAANMAYMGQRHNILVALGINNVMFIAGTKAYWMDEFIKEFRQQKLYLSLDTKGKTWETFELTSHVSLLKYSNSQFQKMMANRKSS